MARKPTKATGKAKGKEGRSRPSAADGKHEKGRAWVFRVQEILEELLRSALMQEQKLEALHEGQVVLGREADRRAEEPVYEWPGNSRVGDFERRLTVVETRTFELEKLSKRMDSYEARLEAFERRMKALEERASRLEATFDKRLEAIERSLRVQRDQIESLQHVEGRVVVWERQLREHVEGLQRRMVEVERYVLPVKQPRRRPEKRQLVDGPVEVAVSEGG